MMLSRTFNVCRNQVQRPFHINNRQRSTHEKGITYFLFKKNLLFTNSLSSGIFMAIGDLVQQEYEYQNNILLKRYDWARSLRMFIVGTAVGPMHHYWYIYLDKMLPKVTVKTVAIKILYDQLLIAPATLVCFIYGICALEGKSIEESTKEFKAKIGFIYMGDWLFWPPVQFYNFYYLPTKYRVFYINFATMIYNVFLSYSKHLYKH